MSVLNDFHKSVISPLVDLERHHGHQLRPHHLKSNGLLRRKQKCNGLSSSSSSTSSGEEMNMIQSGIQLSSLGQNRDPMPATKHHDLNDRKQLELMERTGYEIVQRNGQRIYGGPPPNWKGQAPVKGTEIFVGKVPREMFEWELVPIFEKLGKIYELRLMMDFSGSNRGYLFVRYSKPSEAKLAIRELNNYEIRPGKFIGVIPSVDNRKLWISGLPKNRTADEIRDEMSKLTDGVTAVCIYNSYSDKTKTRGYAFVEYLTHRHAALARRKLVPGRNFLFDQEIERVDWAEPEHEVDPDVMAKVKVLFIRNLTVNTTEDDISAAFEEASDGQIERVKKAKDYAFVHFNTRGAAERAYEATKEHLILDNCRVEVTWSKPIDRHIHSQRKQLSKALISGNITGNPAVINEQHYGSQPPIPVAVNPIFTPQPLIMAAAAAGMNNQHAIRNSLMTPRPGGAAGIRGLGAPGTPLPRNLVRKLYDSNIGQNNQFNIRDQQQFAEMMLKNHQFLSEFAGLSLADSVSAYNGMIPPGAPTSPPSTGASHAHFFDHNGHGNMRFMAPPNMSMQSPLFNYYGGL